MNVIDIYEGSDGKATTALYEHLATLGPAGEIAMNLFRAQKCSTRAKVYSRRYKSDAYARKQWSLANLCKALADHAAALGLVYGWRIDEGQPQYPHVLYVDLPTGQCSFHSPRRLSGPYYKKAWQRKESVITILAFVEFVMNNPFPASSLTTQTPDKGTD